MDIDAQKCDICGTLYESYNNDFGNTNVYYFSNTNCMKVSFTDFRPFLSGDDVITSCNSRPSNVSLTWLLSDECEIRKIHARSIKDLSITLSQSEGLE